jgi:transcriptional regulator of acetoin/glycerol metabolism
MATTNRGLAELLDSGALKPELFYRLDGHRLKVPPLRSRPREIGPIAHEIVTRSGLTGIEPEAIRRLHLFRWPGNVRQLEMILRLAASSCEIGTTLRSTDLEPHLDRLALEGHLAGTWLEGRGAAGRAATIQVGSRPPAWRPGVSDSV